MNLYEGFQRSVKLFPENISLVIENDSFTYKEMELEINKIVNSIKDIDPGNIAIYCYRSLSAYSGILATLKDGRAYIPLNPKFPALRNNRIIDLSECKAIIIDNYSLKDLRLFELLNKDLVLIFPETDKSDIPDLIRKKFNYYPREATNAKSSPLRVIEPLETAYIIFTSGSTGTPKGVAVSHFNAFTYVSTIIARYEIVPEDRFSHLSDITFDLSIHEIFVCWFGGAALYCIPEKSLLAPAKFIKDHRITIWTSVPSMARILYKIRLLNPNSFPDLRYSTFCGEPLPKNMAVAWHDAAPNSVLVNLYGPTETTVGISFYIVPKTASQIAENNGIVSIGEIFEKHEYRLINNLNINEVEEGELCIAGPQVTLGYYRDPHRTNINFVNFEDSDKRWYKTGDIVKMKDNKLYFLYRKDSQVKVRGYRIELEEINSAIRKYTAADFIYTIAFPINNETAECLITFIDKECEAGESEILNHLYTVLPNYMVPKRIIYIKDLPLGINGKIDKKKFWKIYKNDGNG